MGLFKTAEQISAGGITAVYGDTKTGRTRQILERVLASDSKDSVIWLSFGNLNFEGRNLDNWLVANVPTWATFDTEILRAISTKNLAVNNVSPKIIVFEGIDVAARFYVDEEEKKRGKASTQAIYGEVGPKLRSAVAAMSAYADAVYFSILATTEINNGGTAETKLGLNPNAAKLIMPMASNLVYTSVKNTLEPKTGVIVDTAYYAQTNAQKALAFIRGEKVS